MTLPSKPAFALALPIALLASAAEAQRVPGSTPNQSEGRDRAQQQQQPGRPTTVTLGGRTLNLTAPEAAAVAALDTATRGTDRAAQDTALTAAAAAAQSADARYAVGLYQLQIGQQRQDSAMRIQALDALINSGLSTPENLVRFLRSRGDLAFAARDYPTARTAYGRAVELTPNDANVLFNLAQVHIAERNGAAAAPLLQRAIAAKTAAGETVPEPWYRQAMVAAYEARDAAAAIAGGRALLAAYPTSQNWREALVVLRQVQPLDDPAMMEVLRLMRAAGVLNAAGEYQRLAQLLTRAGMASEAKAVLDEGVARRVLTATTSPTNDLITAANQALAQERTLVSGAQAARGAAQIQAADALYSAGRHADAAALYRAALQGRAGDSNLVNLRLGMALAAAGQQAEAEAAFRAVAGPQANLAGYWLAWLARPR